MKTKKIEVVEWVEVKRFLSESLGLDSPEAFDSFYQGPNIGGMSAWALWNYVNGNAVYLGAICLADLSEIIIELRRLSEHEVYKWVEVFIEPIRALIRANGNDLIWIDYSRGK